MSQPILSISDQIRIRYQVIGLLVLCCFHHIMLFLPLCYVEDQILFNYYSYNCEMLRC